jgi:transmembrane sensor
MTMDRQNKRLKEEEQRLQQAGEWFVRLRQEDIPPEQLTAWLEWSRGDPRNLDAFERIRDLSLGLDALDREQKAALVRECLAEPPSARASTVPRRRPLLYALAASLAIAAMAIGYLTLWPRAQTAAFSATYATAKAQNRQLTFPDGTRIELGARSKIHLAYTPNARTVQLHAGEAYFQVKHDARRPFVVWAGRLRVTDIGTAFDVRKNADRTVVSVGDGVVDVSHAEDGQSATSAASSGTVPASQSIQLGAGYRASMDASDPTLAVSTIDRQAIASWRHGRLRFQNAPLSAVIATINRYSKRDIVIANPDVGNMRFTGTVFENRISDWLIATEDVFSLRQKQDKQGRVLLYAKTRR